MDEVIFPFAAVVVVSLNLPCFLYHSISPATDETSSLQLDACLNAGVNNMQINESLQTITNANYKEFMELFVVCICDGL